jgi:hypothetical protein
LASGVGTAYNPTISAISSSGIPPEIRSVTQHLSSGVGRLPVPAGGATTETPRGTGG